MCRYRARSNAFAATFPTSSVVVLVGEHMPYVNHLSLIINSAYQTVAVAPDVEHGALSHRIRVRIDFTHLYQVLPFRLLRNSVPRIQWRFGIGMDGGEFAERLATDH